MKTEEKTMLKLAADRLNDTSEEIRFEAVKDLSRANSLGAVPLLMEAVGDMSNRVREQQRCFSCY